MRHNLKLVLTLAVLSAALGAFANQVPIAGNDTYTTSWDNTLVVNTGGVLVNDSDPDGDTLEAHLFNKPDRGHLTLYKNGTFTYQPEPNYAGDVIFRYRAWDGITADIATVIITVTAGNRAPIANDDSFTTDWDTVLQVNAPGLLANDSDPDGDPLETHVWVYPSRGHLILYRNGGFYYRPEPGYAGPVTFEYKAWDGRFRDYATVTINITEGNNAPVANDDHYTLPCDQRSTVPAPGVQDNDYDPDGDDVVTRLTQGPEVGTLGFHNDGSFWYEPPKGFTGTVSFIYKLEDVPANPVGGGENSIGPDQGETTVGGNNGNNTGDNGGTTIGGDRGNSGDHGVGGSTISNGLGFNKGDVSASAAQPHNDFATVTLTIRCPQTYCPESAYLDAYGGWGGGHAFYLPGGIGKDFHFDKGAVWQENIDGTATLTGTIRREAYPDRGFEVEVTFVGYTTDPPPGSPKREMDSSAYIENGGPIDVSTYYYYEHWSGTLRGIGTFAGGVINFTQRGPAFQLGEGASGKNIRFGGAGWFDWTVATQPDHYNFLNTVGVGDLNIDLVDCD